MPVIEISQKHLDELEDEKLRGACALPTFSMEQDFITALPTSEYLRHLLDKHFEARLFQPSETPEP